ncbi:GGDEF domain-containing protein [Methylobacterium organophilum]|uniref:GGDEF domain-containing protein n=1 Tax=Methylobacterium organophilum TaxID=410 RepID=UPI001F140E22|nr:GGDEF domain-containing protein [Methylobacterium organophilum]UMY16704.1 GGDEF domain-containing protein [Methylobacterium organophilum]
MSTRGESEEVYGALVAELTLTRVPTSIMGLTLLGVGLFTAQVLDDPILFAAAVIGALASVSKLVLMFLHGQRNAQGPLPMPEARQWELRHALSTVCVAGSVGTIAARIFTHPDMAMQMLATALLFGYCSGVVSRLSVRPVIATAAVLLAALPAIVSAARVGDTPHGIIATMFSVFLLGGLDGVRFAYRVAVRQITLRLDMGTLARSDPLTGLANRLGLREAFRKAPRGRDTKIALHFFDLDGFKSVNDRFGHAAGDALLQALSQRLRALLGEAELAARTGGDEFVVLQPSVRDPDEAQGLARRIVDSLSQPYAVAGESVRIGVSLGLSCVPSPSAHLDDLLRDADAASYAIKRKGGGIATRSDDRTGDAQRISA